MIILGFAGKKRSGKTTAAFFSSNYVFSFANPIRRTLQVLFDLSGDQLFIDEYKEEVDPRWNRTPRQLLQWLGTNVMRDQFDEDFWVSRLFSEIDRLALSDSTIVAIDDVRFKNEIREIKRRNGYVINITRDGLPYDDHPSEHALDNFTDWDWIIHNGRSKEDLKAEVDLIVDSARLLSLV